MKWWEYILCGATVLAAIVLLALYIWYVSPRQDSGSDIVAALSICVTILIGWQIYNAIDVNKRIEEIENKFNKRSIFADAESYILTAHSLELRKRYLEALYRTIKAITLYAQVQDYRSDVQNELKCAIDNCAVLLLRWIDSNDSTISSIRRDRKYILRMLDLSSENSTQLNKEHYNDAYFDIIKIIKAIEPVLEDIDVIRNDNSILEKLKYIHSTFGDN